MKKNKDNKNQKVILVNPFDKAIAMEDKLLAHQFGMLHRAFSIFIFRKKNKKIQLLLQQRSKKKYHGGGLWTNTCCSHPDSPHKNMIIFAEKRLKEEMGISVKLKEKGIFHYVAKMKNGLYENEIDHVLVGYFEGDRVLPNSNEVENYKWQDISKIKRDLTLRPNQYTPWFKKALKIAIARTL